MGFKSKAIVISSSKGVNIITIVSFKKNAERTPLKTMIINNNIFGVLPYLITLAASNLKNPDKLKFAFRIIIANINTMVFISMAL